MPDRCSETYLTLFFRPSESDFDMILLLCLWGCGHRVSDVHKSTGFGPSQINGADLLFAEEDMEVAVGLGRTQCHGLSAERLANTPRPIFETDEAVAVDLAQDVARPIDDLAQRLWKRACARPIATGRRIQVERFVRTLEVVDRPPSVEGRLAGAKVGKALSIQNFLLQRTVKAFVLALGLGMKGAGMANPDPQPHQPHRQQRMAPSVGIAPGRTVVRQHRERQSVAAKNRRQTLAHRLLLLVRASLKLQRKPGVIVDRRQRMTATTRQSKVTFEVHLPQFVGSFPLKADERPAMLALSFLELAVPAKDLGDGAQRRDVPKPHPLPPPCDLSRPPRVVVLGTDAKNLRLRRCVRAPRTCMRTPRPIQKTPAALRNVSSQQPMSRVPADAETLAQLAHIGSRQQRKPNKLFPLLHD